MGEVRRMYSALLSKHWGTEPSTSPLWLPRDFYEIWKCSEILSCVTKLKSETTGYILIVYFLWTLTLPTFLRCAYRAGALCDSLPYIILILVKKTTILGKLIQFRLYILSALQSTSCWTFHYSYSDRPISFNTNTAYKHFTQRCQNNSEHLK